MNTNIMRIIFCMCVGMTNLSLLPTRIPPSRFSSSREDFPTKLFNFIRDRNPFSPKRSGPEHPSIRISYKPGSSSLRSVINFVYNNSKCSELGGAVIMADMFDVPFLWENLKKLVAEAHDFSHKSDPDGVVHLTRNPVIRSMLYEAIREKRAKQALDNAMLATKVREKQEQSEEKHAQHRDESILYAREHALAHAHTASQQREALENFCTLLDTLQHVQKTVRSYGQEKDYPAIMALFHDLQDLRQREQLYRMPCHDDSIKDMHVFKKMDIITDTVYAALYRNEVNLDELQEESDIWENAEVLNTAANQVQHFVHYLVHNSFRNNEPSAAEKTAQKIFSIEHIENT